LFADEFPAQGNRKKELRRQSGQHSSLSFFSARIQPLLVRD